MNHLKILGMTCLAAACAGMSMASVATAGELRAGAAHKTLESDDKLVIGGSIGPGFVHGQEGELRASAAPSPTPGAADRVSGSVRWP